MLKIKYKNIFEKDVKRVERRGLNLGELKVIIDLLATEKPLPEKYKDHPLVGKYVEHRECHIKADWLLIYKISDEILILERTGSHSDLFR